MTVSPVIFEDHTWRNFRPLAAGAPVYELRCGLFNMRERVELVLGSPGMLLCRLPLEPLHGRGARTTDVDVGLDTAASAEDGFLWLNGRLHPDADVVEDLAALAGRGIRFVWRDEAGILAASLSAADHATMSLSWTAWRDAPRADELRSGIPTADGDRRHELGGGQWIEVTAGQDPGVTTEAVTRFGRIAGPGKPALRWIWDIVPATSGAIAADVGRVADGREFVRRPFGLAAVAGTEAVWGRPTSLRAGPPGVGVHFTGDCGLMCGDDVLVAPGAAIDTSRGPVVLDNGCRIAPHTYLEGPLYVGPGTRVKAGARIYGESSFGIGNRLAGEIGESTFGDFANKQHAGFIGHAVCGAWINLGAMTTCSDLKNNYGEVRVDLGDGPIESGSRFVGLMMGDHAKTAIGTLFNTGTCVGFATNIFGAGMPPKQVPPFRWGGAADCPGYAVEKAVETASVVMKRRDCVFTPAHAELFRHVAGGMGP